MRVSRSRRVGDGVDVEAVDEGVEVEVGRDHVDVDRLDEIVHVDLTQHGGGDPPDDASDHELDE